MGPFVFLPFHPLQLAAGQSENKEDTRAEIPLRNEKSQELRNRALRKETINMNGNNRVNIKPGLQVSIVLKKDQRDGKLTEGIVKDILTRSPAHPHSIKVRLESGQVGRVKEIAGPKVRYKAQSAEDSPIEGDTP